MYDVSGGHVEQLLTRQLTGKTAAFPFATSEVIVWAAWADSREKGLPSIQAYDLLSTRRWAVVHEGRVPTASGPMVAWVKPGGAGRGDDAIHLIDSITDASSTIHAEGRVRDIAVWGTWAAWLSGRGDTTGVWVGSFHSKVRAQLAASGTAVAIDRNRVIWAVEVGQHSSEVVSWSRRSSRSDTLCRLRGTVSSLSVSDRYAVWVLTRQDTSPQVWAYDFTTGKAFPVSASRDPQVSPAVVGDQVFWADNRGGRWQLLTRSLSR